jgi:acetyl esterase/lipase
MRVYKRDITEQGRRPLLVLHGGTWQNRGSSFLGLEASVSQFTERGFIVFAPFYRLVGEKDGNIECNGASWREVTQDAESALDWVVQNGAALGAVQEPVTVFGQSAGAHLAAWLVANRGNDVRRTLMYYGPTDTLDFLAGAVPLGGPYESYRDFGLKSLSRFFGAQNATSDLHLEQIDFAGLTPSLLSTDWSTLIPDTAFDLSQIDPLAPPVYVARCAAALPLDLTTINLSMPPVELLACMKQDLSEFLIRNSLNHQLSAAAVPIFGVHGSGDTVVPHAQAVNLCGAIDGSLLPVDAVDPITVYSCGVRSQVQIVKDAEHALDLGVCLGPLCPAGPPGSETRNAAAAVINASYVWLLQDDPCIPSQFGTGCTTDTDSDGTPDSVEGETTDSDGDGTPDYQEPDNVDTDGDGVSDEADPANTDPCIPSQFGTGCTTDTDSDGTPDSGGGSTGWLSLLALTLFARRRFPTAGFLRSDRRNR